MTLVQITQVSGTVRGPVDEYRPPDDGLIQLHLASDRRVVQVEWRRGHEFRNRRTVDWTWTATIEWRSPDA